MWTILAELFVPIFAVSIARLLHTLRAVPTLVFSAGTAKHGTECFITFIPAVNSAVTELVFPERTDMNIDKNPPAGAGMCCNAN